jgi:dynein heavy chain 2
VLAWFHAIIQERRMYIPQGWTKFYEFTSADLRTAMLIISRVCDAPNADGSINWTDIHGMNKRPFNC